MRPFFRCFFVISCFLLKQSCCFFLCRLLSRYRIVIGSLCVAQRLLGIPQRLLGIGDIAFQLVAGDTVVFLCVIHCRLCRFELLLCLLHAVFCAGHTLLGRKRAGVQPVFIVFLCIFIRLAADLDLVRRLVFAGVHRRLLLGDVHLQIVGFQLCQHVPLLHHIADLHVDLLHQIAQGGVDLSARLAFHHTAQADGVLQIHLL